MYSGQRLAAAARYEKLASFSDEPRQIIVESYPFLRIAQLLEAAIRACQMTGFDARKAWPASEAKHDRGLH